MSSKYSIGNILNYVFDTVMFVLAAAGLTYLATEDATLNDSTFYTIAFFLWIIQNAWRAIWPLSHQGSVEKQLS